MTFDAERFREILNSVLDERNRVDAETHETHHQWVANRIECDVRRRAIFDGIVKTIFGAAGLGGLTWLGAQILKAIRGE